MLALHWLHSPGLFVFIIFTGSRSLWKGHVADAAGEEESEEKEDTNEKVRSNPMVAVGQQEDWQRAHFVGGVWTRLMHHMHPGVPSPSCSWCFCFMAMYGTIIQDIVSNIHLCILRKNSHGPCVPLPTGGPVSLRRIGPGRRSKTTCSRWRGWSGSPESPKRTSRRRFLVLTCGRCLEMTWNWWHWRYLADRVYNDFMIVWLYSFSRCILRKPMHGSMK